MSIKFLHAADFHLDSPFAGLSTEQAKQRRRESRRTLERLTDYVNKNDIQLVLLAGDLFDGALAYRETLEALTESLGAMTAQVFIAPGNHDPYSSRSPYAALRWPKNVHIFCSREIERVELPELGCAVYGAAFTEEAQETSLLDGFSAPEDGLVHLMVLHADLCAGVSHYAPLTRAQIAASALDYLALGHIHRFDGAQTAGRTTFAYAGCIEGRGFDETGDKGFVRGEAEPGSVNITFIPFALRRYWTRQADVTGKTAADAMESVISGTTEQDVCRVTFTGETDERGVDIKDIRERFVGRFHALELRDETHIRQNVWARAGEDSLRALFLRELRARYDGAQSEEERRLAEQAARFGLAALDGRDL